MKYKNLFGNKIKELRGDMSLRDFADKIGISHTYLASIEKGESPRNGKPVNITGDTIITISKNLGINPHELFSLDMQDKSDRSFSIDEHKYTYPEEIPTINNQLGEHDANLLHLASKPELLEIYNDIYESENLQLLFDTARGLTPDELEAVLNVIKMIHKGE